MQETTRRQYLALLGVELWLPRAAVDAGDAAGDTPAGAIAPVAAGNIAPAVETASPTPVRESAPESTRQVAPGSGTVAPPAAVAPPAMPAAAVVPPAAPVPAPAPAATTSATATSVETLGCSLLSLPDGLLLLATYVTPQAPGLSGPEHALLASIAGALVPGAALPAPDEFRWPPAGVRLPAVARAGAGADALVGLLAEQRRKRGLRDVLVLGESLAPVLDGIGARLGLRVVLAPSLAAMLSDPALKRACWDAAKPLRRGGA